MMRDNCEPVQSVVYGVMHMLVIGSGSAHRGSLLVVDGGGDSVCGVSSDSCSCIRVGCTLDFVGGVAGGVGCGRGWSVSGVVMTGGVSDGVVF